MVQANDASNFRGGMNPQTCRATTPLVLRKFGISRYPTFRVIDDQS